MNGILGLWEFSKSCLQAFSGLGICQELARAVVFREFSKPGLSVTELFDQIPSTATFKYATHFPAAIESTCIVLVLSSRVPITFTFLPTNFSGVRWSLSV